MKHKFILIILSLFIVLTSISFINAPLIDDIILYYKLDEQDTTGSGIIYDELGAHNGTNNGASNTTGLINTAYDFENNEGDYITFGDVNAVEGLSEITISVWIKPETMGGTDADFIITKENVWYFRTRTTSTFGFTIHGDAGDVRASVTAGEWTHLMVTWDNIDGYVMYRNGFEVDTLAKGASMPSTAYPLTIGAKNNDGGAWGNFFDGKIDEVAIWNTIKVLADAESLYAAGVGNQYPFVVDTCSCPGLNNNWEINMADNCIIVDDCDLGTGTLSFTGSGWCNCSARIDTTNLGDPGANGILYIANSCLLTID